MPVTVALSEAEARTIAERVLGRILGPSGYDHAEVHAGPDHDGEDSLMVVAVLKPHTPLLPSNLYAAAYEAVDDAIRATGERRFSYFRVLRPDEPVGLAEDEA